MTIVEPGRAGLRERSETFGGIPLSAAAEAFPFAFLITDGDGVVRDANRAGARLFGLEHGDLVGKAVVDLVPAEYRRTVGSALAAVGGDRTPFTWEQNVRRADGMLTAVEVSAFHLPAEGRKLVAWTFQDIRDRVAVEQRLRLSHRALEARVLDRTVGLEAERALLAALMRQIPAGLVIVDSAGQILSANDEALRIFGLESSRHLDIGRIAARSRRMDGSRYGPGEWPLGRSLAGEDVSVERIALEADGAGDVVLDVSSSPVEDASGRMIGAVCLFIDVTVRERRERIEREFVANAAHELQTPLAALVGATEVLMSGAKDTPDRDLFLGHIARESERLTRLVRGLLVLARAELGAEQPVLSLVDVAPTLEGIARELTTAPGVTVSTSCPQDLAVLSNPELLGHAIANVAENATKYTREGSIRLEARERSGAVEITIEDTGPGIPVEEQAHVFERFHRGSGGTGSGLGLAITRAVMDVLGGGIELESTVGAGTVIRLRVPRATAVVSS